MVSRSRKPAVPALPSMDEALTHVALLRGINVGTAKRIAMSDLRDLLGELGLRGAKTLLNSGNAVFAARASAKGLAAKDLRVEALATAIERGIAERVGVHCRVTVLERAEMMELVQDNTLAARATDPARMMVAVPCLREDLARLAPLAARDWGAEALAIGRRAAYLWCAEGILKSSLAAAIEKTLRDGVTSRNWTTTQKLLALLDS